LGIGKTVGLDYFRIYTVGVVSNTPPVVTLTSPADGAVFFTTNPVVLSATAGHASGAVADVQFFRSNSLLSTLTSAPYAFALSNLAAGQYAFRVVATDNTGLRATSAVANITVGFGAPATLIPQGATWRYFDQTNDLGTAWRSNSFNDAAWSNGVARLGFGNDGEVTKVSSNRQWTTYFRREFYVPNPALVTNLTARLTRDDGAVIYLNGAEVWRHNMPTGLITNQTPAASTVSSPAETNWYSTNLNASLLQPDWNLLAAEVHQVSLTSSDLGFDFELSGTQVLLQSPALALDFSSGAPALSWPPNNGIFTLHTAPDLTWPVVWTALTTTPTLSNGIWIVPLGNATNGQRFYRLQTP
jgi:hypothetical protein